MGNSYPYLLAHAPPLPLKKNSLLTLLAGVTALALAYLLPLRFFALEERLLVAAGQNTPTLVDFTSSLLNAEHLGAGLRLALLSRSLKCQGSQELLRFAQTIFSSRRDLAWLGTRDPRLESILATSGLAFEKTSATPPPILSLILREPVRLRLRENLRANPSPAVQSILQTLPLPPLPPLLPTSAPGGQPLEATLLLTAHLLDTAAFSPSLASEIKTATLASLDENSLRPLQPALLALLSLAHRYDYDSLREILSTLSSLPPLLWLADQLRSPAEPADLLLAAALWVGPTDRLASLPLPSAQPFQQLSTALASGRGSLELLLQRPRPTLRHPLPFPPAWASSLLRWEKPLLLIRLLLLFFGSWWVVAAVWRLLPDLAPTSPGPWRPAPRLAQSLLLALFLGTLCEPALLQPRPLPQYRLHLAVPSKTVSLKKSPRNNMDPTNLVTLAVFLALQIAVYRICLRRMRQIEDGPGDPALKLRLLENEDNLFDAGLYVGIAGTATALVLQVLGIIQPSLLAAYASNLFGIACVAVVKIFHVRALKQRLLLPPPKS